MRQSLSTPWSCAIHFLKAGLMIIRPDGTIDQVNDSWRQMALKIGASPHFEWTGTSFFEITPQIFGKPSVSDFWITIYTTSLKNVLTGKNSNYTVEYSVDSSRNTTWILCEAHSLTLEKDVAPHGMIVSFSDITRYKQKELNLEQALSHTCSFHGHVPICAVCKDIRTAEVWEPVESYLKKQIPIEFTHDICPGCIRKLYPKYSSFLDK